MDNNHLKSETSKNKPDYHAYLLRVWSENGQAAGPTWRFVLLDPQSGKRHGFQSMNALFDFLSVLTQAKEKDGKGMDEH